MWIVCSLLTLIVWLWRYHWSNVAKKRRKLSNHKHEIWKSSKMNHLIIWTRPRNIYLKRNKTEWKGNIEKPMKRKERKPFEKTYGRRNKTKSWIEGCGSECLMNWKRIRIQFTLEIIFFRHNSYIPFGECHFLCVTNAVTHKSKLFSFYSIRYQIGVIIWLLFHLNWLTWLKLIELCPLFLCACACLFCFNTVFHTMTHILFKNWLNSSLKSCINCTFKALFFRRHK